MDFLHFVPSESITTAFNGYMTNNERRAVNNTASGKLVFRGALEFAHNHLINEQKAKKYYPQKSRMPLVSDMQDFPYSMGFDLAAVCVSRVRHK
jgi:hypothetical protein